MTKRVYNNSPTRWSNQHTVVVSSVQSAPEYEALKFALTGQALEYAWQGCPKKLYPLKFLAYLVVLCFERRCPKQNTVAHLKSKYLAPPNILGWLHY